MLVRQDEDFSIEAEALDRRLVAVISVASKDRNAVEENTIRARLDKIRSERIDLQSALERRFPEYVALSKPLPISVSDTQKLLSGDEALIAFDFNTESYVWIITKEREVWKQISLSADGVSKIVAALRSSLDPNSPKPFDANLAYQLYKQVLGPVEGIISNKARLSFVLDGALTSLPPQVLITSDPAGKKREDVDWLVRKYAITVLPSTASLKILRVSKTVVSSAKPMIGFGDPIFDRSTRITIKLKPPSLNRSLPEFYRGAIADAKSLAQGLPPLPETADELRGVAKQLGSRSEDIKLGEAARPADEFEHLGRCSLPLSRLIQLAGEPRDICFQGGCRRSAKATGL
jgi:CHAT domain-containing protein